MTNLLAVFRQEHSADCMTESITENSSFFRIEIKSPQNRLFAQFRNVDAYKSSALSHMKEKSTSLSLIVLNIYRRTFASKSLDYSLSDNFDILVYFSASETVSYKICV